MNFSVPSDKVLAVNDAQRNDNGFPTVTVARRSGKVQLDPEVLTDLRERIVSKLPMGASLTPESDDPDANPNSLVIFRIECFAGKVGEVVKKIRRCVRAFCNGFGQSRKERIRKERRRANGQARVMVRLYRDGLRN